MTTNRAGSTTDGGMVAAHGEHPVNPNAERFGADELMALAGSAPVGLFVAMAPDGVVLVNDHLEEITGRREDELLGVGWIAAIHPEDRAWVLEETREPRAETDLEHRVLRPDGTVRWVRIRSAPLHLDGRPAKFVGSVLDITEVRASEASLRASEARFRSLIEHSFDSIVVIDRDGTVRYASPSTNATTGYPPGSQIGGQLFDLVHPDDVATVRHAIDDAERLTTVGAGSSAPLFTFRGRHRDGHWLTFEASVADLTENLAVGGVVITAHDVTSQRATEAALRDSETRLLEQAALLEMIATSAPIEDTLAEVCRVVESQLPGARCSVLLADDTLQILRYGAAPSFPASFLEATDGLAIKEGSAVCGTAAARGEVVVVPDMLDDPTCAEYADLARANRIRGCWSTPVSATIGGRVLGTFAVYLDEPRGPDATEQATVEAVAALAAIAIVRHDFESALADQAHHDTLTGLPNRNLFGELLEHALRRAQRSQSAVAVLFLDLDRFKIVNDSLGHDAGDELLGAISRRLESVLRPGDVVARFGGDEFTVLCEDLQPEIAGEQVISVADRLVGALRDPFSIDGDELFVGVSVGIAVGLTGLEQPDALLRDADAAMYRAKERGRGRCEVFDETMREQARDRHEVEHALHRAVARQEFVVFYQPVIELRSGNCVGVEALARWQHPDRGLIGPREFLRSAEESGLVVPIGELVLDLACRKAVEWLAAAPRPDRFRLSVNFSSRQLLHADVSDLVADVLDRSALSPQALCIEVAETAVMNDPEAAAAAVKSLKGLGVQVCIDDFGTGYSALSYLREFSIDEVKIDGSFVARLGSEPEDAAIVAAVVSLGHALGVTVTGEGVETTAQCEALRALGVDAAQGFLFAPPQPAADLTIRLLAGRRWI